VQQDDDAGMKTKKMPEDSGVGTVADGGVSFFWHQKEVSVTIFLSSEYCDPFSSLLFSAPGSLSPLMSFLSSLRNPERPVSIAYCICQDHAIC
jgi:hypothetical protein